MMRKMLVKPMVANGMKKTRHVKSLMIKKEKLGIVTSKVAKHKLRLTMIIACLKRSVSIAIDRSQ